METDFCWVNGIAKLREDCRKNALEAYRAEEIFDLLPDYIRFPGTTYECEFEEIPNIGWRIFYTDGTYILNNKVILGLNAVDTMAEMIIYLIEEDLYGFD